MAQLTGIPDIAIIRSGFSSSTKELEQHYYILISTVQVLNYLNSTVQYSTVQYNTVQSKVRYSTV